MPAKVRIKILQARNLPVMSKTHGSTDAFVEVKIGQDAYKTDVCWRSLDPEWVNDWFRFELSDQAFFEEPVQIRVMDHDTYSSHDAIGKVQMRLSQFLNVRVSEIKGQHHVKEWFPIYDTLHGQRGVLLLELVMLPFGELAFPPVLCCSNYPYGVAVRRIYGLVDCAVLTDDPEYQWMDRIRASRTTNEARQLLFSKMSGAVRRRIALKARRVGANGIIGYCESLDVCCDAGVVMRAIGTAVRVDLPTTRPVHHHHSRTATHTNANHTKVASGATDDVSTLLAGQHQQQTYSFFVDDEAFISGGADGDGGGGGSKNLDKLHASDDELESGAQWLGLSTCEFPFVTTTTLPDKLVIRVGGLVSTRIVKKLSELEDINTHGVDYRLLPDSWLCDVRQEIRHHMLAADCNAVYGYQELVYPVPDEDVVIISAKATAVELVCDLAAAASQGRTSADLLFHHHHVAAPSSGAALSSSAGAGGGGYNNPYGAQFINGINSAERNACAHHHHHAEPKLQKIVELSVEEGTLALPNRHLGATTTTTGNASGQLKSAATSSGTAAASSTSDSSSDAANNTAYVCQYAATSKRHDLFLRVAYSGGASTTTTGSASSCVENEPRVIVPSVVVSNAEPLACVDFVGRGTLIQVRVVKSFRKGVSDRVTTTSSSGGGGVVGASVGAALATAPHTIHGAAGAVAGGVVGLVGAVSNAKRTYKAWHARRRGFGIGGGGGSSEHSSVAAITTGAAAAAGAGHSPGTAILTRERRSEMDVATTNISDKRRLTELLSFIEFELFSQLIGKLKVLGLNSVWKLNETLWIGKHRVVAVASGTAAYVIGLPGRPALPLVSSVSEGVNDAPDIVQQLMQFRQGAWKTLGIRQATGAAAAVAAVKQPATAEANSSSSSRNRQRSSSECENDMDRASVTSQASGFVVPLLPKSAFLRQEAGRIQQQRTLSPILRIELDSISDTRRLVDLLDRFVSPSVVLTTSETMPHQHHHANANIYMPAASSNVCETFASAPSTRPLRSGKLSTTSTVGSNTLFCGSANIGLSMEIPASKAVGQNVASASWLLPGEAFVRIILCRAASLDETLADLMRYFRVMAGAPFGCDAGSISTAEPLQQQQQQPLKRISTLAGINRRSSSNNIIDEAGENSSSDATGGTNTTASCVRLLPLLPTTTFARTPPVNVLGLELSLDTIEEADDDDLMLLTIQGTIFGPATALDQLLLALRQQHASLHSSSQHHQNLQHAATASGSISAFAHPHHQHSYHHHHPSSVFASTASAAGASVGRRAGGRTSMQAAARSQSRELNSLLLHKQHGASSGPSSVTPLHPSQLLKSSTDILAHVQPQQPSPPGDQIKGVVNLPIAGAHRAHVGSLAMLHQQSLSTASSSATNSPLRYLSQPAGVPVGSATAVGGFVAALSSGGAKGKAAVQRFARTSLEHHVLATSSAGQTKEANAAGVAGDLNGSSSSSSSFRAFEDVEPPVYMSTLSYVPAPAKIVAYIGLINYYVIREEMSLRESGSLIMEKTSQFLHGSLLQFAAMLRTLTRAMGGNALLSLSVRQVQLMGRSQVLCHLTGDVVQMQ